MRTAHRQSSAEMTVPSCLWIASTNTSTRIAPQCDNLDGITPPVSQCSILEIQRSSVASHGRSLTASIETKVAIWCAKVAELQISRQLWRLRPSIWCPRASWSRTSSIMKTPSQVLTLPSLVMLSKQTTTWTFSRISPTLGLERSWSLEMK